MESDRRSGITAAEVLTRIQSEIAAPTASEGTTPFAERMAHIQTMQRSYRSEPVGGRLVVLKRLIAWFTASTFDRQAKVIEALLDLVDDLGTELDVQNRELDSLRSEIRGLLYRPKRD